ncbi:MAG: hypothetical protein JJT95_19280, partial [Pararhodobacter sp.]|nr:hypothetical protein [Pararhodobacter sp.]
MDARRTFRLDRFRGSCHGILETGTQTFLLLVAIRVFEAGPTAGVFGGRGGRGGGIGCGRGRSISVV